MFVASSRDLIYVMGVYSSRLQKHDLRIHLKWNLTACSLRFKLVCHQTSDVYIKYGLVDYIQLVFIALLRLNWLLIIIFLLLFISSPLWPIGEDKGNQHVLCKERIPEHGQQHVRPAFAGAVPVQLSSLHATYLPTAAVPRLRHRAPHLDAVPHPVFWNPFGKTRSNVRDEE